MHYVTEAELEGIASGGTAAGISLAFFGISVGALVAFSITLATVDVKDPITHATFVGLTWISGLTTLFFAVRSFMDSRKAKKSLRNILNGDDSYGKNFSVTE